MTVPADGVVALDPQVALRPERFGALAYHFGNRKLSFLKHPDLVAVLEAADGSRTVAELFDAFMLEPRLLPPLSLSWTAGPAFTA